MSMHPLSTGELIELSQGAIRGDVSQAKECVRALSSTLFPTHVLARVWEQLILGSQGRSRSGRNDRSVGRWVRGVGGWVGRSVAWSVAWSLSRGVGRLVMDARDAALTRHQGCRVGLVQFPLWIRVSVCFVVGVRVRGENEVRVRGQS